LSGNDSEDDVADCGNGWGVAIEGVEEAVAIVVVDCATDGVVDAELVASR
jgi:hypothetical protein